MQKKEIKTILNIRKTKVPVYRQIIEQLTQAINTGQITSGDLLPSINDISNTFSLSRDTVQKAYNHLKRIGAIDSVQGKGFYVCTEKVKKQTRIFLLFDVLFTNYKEELYNSIKQYLDEKEFFIDVFFHHQNPEVFHDIISKAYGYYDCYVIMPLTNDNESLADVYDKLANDVNLLLLDIQSNLPTLNFNSIVQDHDHGFEQALLSKVNEIKKYNELILVFPEDRYHPRVIKNAFKRFVMNNGIKSRIIEKLTCSDIQKDTLFILLENSDLVRLIKHCRINKPDLWDEIGCIAYNDSPLKEIIEGGISVVSTDFHEMGKRTAEFIKHREKVNLLIPTKIIRRKSF